MNYLIYVHVTLCPAASLEDDEGEVIYELAGDNLDSRGVRGIESALQTNVHHLQPAV